MNTLIKAALFFSLSAPVLAADVAVSVTVGQPGFYGQINLGNAPAPQLIDPQPVIIVPPPPPPPGIVVAPVVVQPLYLRVPLRHRKHWGKYCHRYNACGVPVYFVTDRWYNEQYIPHYRTHRDEYRSRDDHDRRDAYRDRNERRQEQRRHEERRRDEHRRDERRERGRP